MYDLLFKCLEACQMCVGNAASAFQALTEEISGCLWRRTPSSPFYLRVTTASKVPQLLQMLRDAFLPVCWTAVDCREGTLALNCSCPCSNGNSGVGGYNWECRWAGNTVTKATVPSAIAPPPPLTTLWVPHTSPNKFHLVFKVKPQSFG